MLAMREPNWNSAIVCLVTYVFYNFDFGMEVHSKKIKGGGEKAVFGQIIWKMQLC